MAADFNTPNYHVPGGAEWVVGGVLRIATGGQVVPNSGTQASAIPDLTDSTGGTANDTLAALPTLTDSPASADALRDDITTNLMPVLKSNFADLGAKVNAILTVLRNLGFIASS